MSLQRSRLKARVAYGGLGRPVEHGVVVMQDAAGDERILFVGEADEAERRWPDAVPKDAGFAVSPPPVNAHAHLDLTTMPFVEDAYEAFIRAVIAHGRNGGRGLDAAKRGVAELRAVGTHTVGDIVADEVTMRWLLSEAELQGVAYWEVFAPDPADADRTFEDTVEKLRAFRALERPGKMRVGLAPHTPHTVSAPLLQRLARLAQANDIPMQIHVAESPSEVTLHATGDGPLRALMGPLLANFTPSGLSPVQYLADLGVLEARPTLVHGVQVDEADVRTIQRAGSVVVHCPRSNAALQCGRFPWELYAKHGATVAFGTDSRGSSPSLDVQEEVLAAAGQHGARANPAALVWSAVKGGHRALGSTPPRIVRGDPAEGLVTWRVQVHEARPVSDI